MPARGHHSLQPFLDNPGLLEAVSDPVYIVDRELRIVAHNRALLPLSRATGPELLARPRAREVLVLDRWAEEELRSRAAPSDRAVELREVSGSDREGNPVSLVSRALPLFDGSGAPAGALVHLRDLTAEARMHAKYEGLLRGEREEKERAQSLSRELEGTVRELRAAQGELVKMEKLATLGNVVAGIAHELNNPLTVILGYADLAMATVEDEAMRRDLGRIHGAASRAQRVVQELLLFTRKRTPAPVPTRINALVERTLDEQEQLLAGYGLELVRDLEPDLPATALDPFQMQQVLVNLVKNAADAVDGQPRRRVAVRTRRSPGVGLRVEVEDSGCGIPEDALERVFEPFYTTKPPGKGTGLGLPICRRILEDHGGRIWAERRPGGGTLFVLELPLREAPEPVGRPEEAGVLAGHRVLVVEDEADIRELMVRYLKEWGCAAHAVPGVAAALSALDSSAFDALIVDVALPDGSGHDLYRRLERERPEAARRVVFITGRVADEQVVRSLEATGRPVHFKPFAVEAVQGTLLGMLRPRPADEERSVLVVDDDAEVRSLLVRMLGGVPELGCEVRAVASGAEALRALGERPYGVVLADIRMPDMGGLDLLGRVRSRHPSVAVVLMTQFHDPFLALEAPRRGAAGYLAKPVDPAELVRVLGGLLGPR
ncbi:MAG: response regulator [Planctomycetes bacterium]|nr:response regulator [Planctomycetota bacterium]